MRVEHDYSREEREIRRELIPYIKDARSMGHKIFMRNNKLVVNGRTYSVGEPEEKLKLVTKKCSMNNPDGGMR
jgi:hypothetical protein